MVNNYSSKKFVALKICRLIVRHTALLLPLLRFNFFEKKIKIKNKGGLNYIWPSIIKTLRRELCYFLKA